ncbi:transposase [Variovorax sp.]|uniref:transposase n=1 Tax=Variovorax sp. TaxID=1871043 RepID=UPI0034214DF5
MPESQRARQLRPQLPSHWQARLIEVSVGGRRRRFITSLQGARAHPARQLADLYRQRWEIELGFREIKQSLQDAKPVLRSKHPSWCARSCGACRSPTRCCAAGWARWPSM